MKVTLTELRNLIRETVREQLSEALDSEEQKEQEWDKDDLFQALKYLFVMVYRRGEEYNYALDWVSDLYDIPKDVLDKELEDFDGTYVF